MVYLHPVKIKLLRIIGKNFVKYAELLLYYIPFLFIIFHMQVHNWNSKCVHPFIQMKYAGKFYIKSMVERQKFTQFLANGLPRRTLYSVLNRFKYLFGNHEKSFQRYHIEN